MAILVAYICYVGTPEAVEKSHLLLNHTGEEMIGLCPFITCTTNQYMYMYMYMPWYSSSETKLITFYGFSARLFGWQIVTYLVVKIFNTFHRCNMCVWGNSSTMSYNYFPHLLLWPMPKYVDFRHRLSSFCRETKEFYKLKSLLIIIFIRDESVQ